MLSTQQRKTYHSAFSLAIGTSFQIFKTTIFGHIKPKKLRCIIRNIFFQEILAPRIMFIMIYRISQFFNRGPTKMDICKCITKRIDRWIQVAQCKCQLINTLWKCIADSEGVEIKITEPVITIFYTRFFLYGSFLQWLGVPMSRWTPTTHGRQGSCLLYWTFYSSLMKTR